MAKLAAVAARHHARTHAAARWARRRDGSSRGNSKDGADASDGENVAPSRIRVVEVPRPEGPQTWLAATVLPDGTATVTELTAPTESPSSVALGAQTKLRGPWAGTEDFVVDVHWTCSGQQSQHVEENRASGKELLVGVSDGTLWRFKIIIGGEHLECEDNPIPIAPSFCALGLTSFAVDAEGGIWTGGLLSPPTCITRQGQSYSLESAWAGEVTCIFPIPQASSPSSSASSSPSVLLGFANDLVALCTSSQEPAFIKYDGKSHGGVKDFVVARDKEKFEILCVFADGQVGSLDVDAREMNTRVALPAETTVLAVTISNSANVENDGCAKQFLFFATPQGIVRLGLEDKSSSPETLVDWSDVLSVATLCCKSKSGCAYLAVLTRSKLVTAACREDETENTQISVTSALRKLESLAAREEKLQLISLELDARLESISKLGVLTSGALACAIRMEVTKSVSCLPFGREAEFGAHDMTRGNLIAIATLTGPKLPPDWTCIVAVEQGSELAPGATAPPPASIFSWRIHELRPTTSTNTSNENECSFSAVVPLRAFSEVPVRVNVWIVPRGREPRGHLIASQKFSVLSMARSINSSKGNFSHSHTAEPASRVKRLTQALRPHAATDQNVQNWPVVLPGPVSDDDASLGRERLRWGEATLEVIHCDGDIPTLDRVVCSDPALAVAVRAAIVEANAAAHVKLRSSFVRDLVQRSRAVEGISEQLLADLCRYEQTPENCTTSEMIELLQRSWQLYQRLRFETQSSDQGEKKRN